MSEIMTDEEIVRAALVRLNPDMHEYDQAWYALDRLVNPSGPDLRAACETYLHDNGWMEDHGGWEHEPINTDSVYYRGDLVTLGEALDIQLARDGIGGAE